MTPTQLITESLIGLQTDCLQDSRETAVRRALYPYIPHRRVAGNPTGPLIAIYQPEYRRHCFFERFNRNKYYTLTYKVAWSELESSVDNVA